MLKFLTRLYTYGIDMQVIQQPDFEETVIRFRKEVNGTFWVKYFHISHEMLRTYINPEIALMQEMNTQLDGFLKELGLDE